MITIRTSPEIVFFGTDEFSLVALTALIEASYTIAAVVTKPDSKQGRGQKITPPLVKVLATGNNIPVWQPENLRDITKVLTDLSNPIGVLSSYGKIIPQSTIDLFTPGIINIHPSLLPKYRGPTPIETAIANGDDKTGVSIMQLTAGMDAGPVYTAKEYPLTKKETKTELYHALATVGANLLLETLPNIIDGSLSPIPQDEKQASYTKMLSKEDAYLRPELVGATEAEQQVRAHLGFPKSKLTIQGQTIIVTKAHVSDIQQNQLDIPCRDGKYLSVDELIGPSGRRMNAGDFERGYLRS